MIIQDSSSGYTMEICVEPLPEEIKEDLEVYYRPIVCGISPKTKKWLWLDKWFKSKN